MSCSADTKETGNMNRPHLHGTGQAYLTALTPSMVAEAPDPTRTFADYAQQMLGMPWATTKDLIILRQRVNDIFDRYPQATYFTLCRLALWCKDQGIRRSRVYLLIDLFRDAWAAGVLPELDTPRLDPDVEARIADALRVETDRSWRKRLIGAQGIGARRAVLAAWLDAHV